MSGPRPQSLESWLRRQCKQGAARFRCTTDEGAKLVRVAQKGKRGPDTVSALRAVTALDPGRVEALSDEGEVLDVFDVPDPDEGTELPGYTKEDDDTKEERLLKTFAHLLADAHKVSARQLVEVVSLQSHGFQEERRHMHGALAATDRLLRRMSNPRVRVSTEPGEEGEGEGEGGDNFMATILGPLLQRMVRQEIAGGAGGEPDDEPAAAKTNGTKGAAQ